MVFASRNHISRLKTALKPMLIKTKITPPRHFHDLVIRQRLIEKLDRIRGGQLVLLTAPMGYSKTTLVSQWLQAADNTSAAKNPSKPYGWLTLDIKDNDPARFWRYLFAALNSAGLTLAELSSEVRPEQCPSILINSLQERQDETQWLLILDDFQNITNEDITNQLNELLDFIPANFSIIITSQLEPPLRISRRRSKHQLVELCQEQLAFSRTESDAFISKLLPIDIADTTLQRLHSKSEGWPAGLQLMSIVLDQSIVKEQPVETSLLRNLSHPITFFDDEVLAHLPEELKRFLLSTAFLPWLHPGLCDAILGIDNSHEIIEQLKQRNLFLMKYGEAHRYHDLFKEALLSHNEHDELLRVKAAQWFHDNAFFNQAIDQYIRLQDWDNVTYLMTLDAHQKLAMGEYITIEQWLTSLPEDLLNDRPRLLALKAAIQLEYCDFEKAAKYAAQARDRFDAYQRDPELIQYAKDTHQDLIQCQQEIGIVESYLAMFKGDYAKAQHLSLKVLATESDNQHLEIFARLPLSNAYINQGQLDDARDILENNLETSIQNNLSFPAMISITNLIPVYLMTGEMEKAQATINRVDSWYQQLPQKSSYEPWISGMKAYLLREQGKLEDAEKHVQPLLAYTQHTADPLQLIPIYAIASHIYGNLGDSPRARQLLEQADLTHRQYGESWQFSFPRPSTILLNKEVRDNNQPPLLDWLVTNEQRLLADQSFLNEAERIFMMSIYLVLGRFDDAITLGNEIEQLCQQHNRKYHHVRVLISLSLAYAAKQDFTQAMEAIKSALLIAEQAKFFAVFLEGMPYVSGLLKMAQPYYYGEILEPLLAFIDAREPFFTDAPKTEVNEPEKPTAQNSTSIMTEALSKRENQVLGFLAQGLKNQEIADQLFLSITTVKTHVHNIYSKMDVRNRTEAVTKARTLNLI